MMIKHIYTLLLLLLTLTSCQDININKEVKYTQLLDSALLKQQGLINNINTKKIESCIQLAQERAQLFESADLNNFQKQWLHHDKLAYQTIADHLKHQSHQIDSIKKEFEYSKNQIQHLKEDLIHRQIDKHKFKNYFTDEQKALAELSILSATIIESSQEKLKSFDALENKLQHIISQLDAIKKSQNEPSEKH